MSEIDGIKEDTNGVSNSLSAGEDNTNTIKRKKNLSINDYFTKRRKMSTDNNKQDDVEKRRELMASAAEKRTKISAFTETEAEKRLSAVSNKVLQNEDTMAINDDPIISLGVKNNDLDDVVTVSYINNHEPAKVQIPQHFNRSHLCSDILPNLTPTGQHSIHFRPHVINNKVPKPFPDSYKDRWDRYHVRMPCSPENLYPTNDKKIQKRWELIEATLLQPFHTSQDLEEAILVYNHHYKDKWNFESWHSYCNIQLTSDEQDELFSNTLPNMVKLALQLPNIVTTSPKLLYRGKSHSITFSQKQIACLLANAFFCTYPKRNSLKTSEYSSYPDINFSKLFRGIKDVVNGVKTEKLKAILNYFKRVLTEMPTGTVTYTRQVIDDEKTPNWGEQQEEFSDLYVSSDGTIEGNADGLLQVDFANRMIGGGVVGEGCVQEEIRFLMCPELILSRLFTEKLEPNESLLITGVERYSSYSGYAQTFKYIGPYNDFTPRDRWGRRHTQVIAIDAHVFHCFNDQINPVSMKRELKKAFCGFRDDTLPVHQRSAIATGNWGCGAFGGDTYLKSLLQLMAAAVAKRDMVYFTFGDEKFTKELHDMHEFMQKSHMTVGSLWHMLIRYRREVLNKNKHIELFPYIKQVHGDYTSETDDEGTLSSGENPLEIRGVPCEIPDDMEPLSPDYIANTP